jgi:glyoxylase-like metal-dependent hydrolase (beta-lactamase superfamily II)
MQITESVHLIPGVVANPYLIVEADGLTLIDAGLPRAHGRILSYIASLGRRPTDLKRIILTHSDLDHIGGLADLVRLTGARAYSSQIEAEAIARGRPSRAIRPAGISARRVMYLLLGPFMRATPVQVDEILRDGQVLPILGGLQVLATAGHTAGHLSLFAGSEHILFCGDSLVSDHGLLPSRPGLTWDQAAAAESVRKQAALGAEIVCSGHGPVVLDAAGKFPAA